MNMVDINITIVYNIYIIREMGTNSIFYWSSNKKTNMAANV